MMKTLNQFEFFFVLLISFVNQRFFNKLSITFSCLLLFGFVLIFIFRNINVHNKVTHIKQFRKIFQNKIVFEYCIVI